MFIVLTRILARPVIVLLLTIAAVVGLGYTGRDAASRLLSGGTEDPASQSALAADALTRDFPNSRPNLLLIVTPTDGKQVDDPAVQAAGHRITEALQDDPDVVGVTSYFTDPAPNLLADADHDVRPALVMARIPGDETTSKAIYDRVVPEAVDAGGDAVTTQVAGPIAVRSDMQTMISQDLVRAEVMVMPLVLIVLILAFGSAIAALLPLFVGLIAVVGATAVLGGLTRVTDVSIFSMNLTTAMGLGLAIDYAMIMVRRFREELHTGVTPRQAATTMLATAGRTVMFSAVTVAASLSVMLLFPLYFLRSFAYAGMAVVAFAALSTLIVVPACLVLLGRRVNALDISKLFRARNRGSHVQVRPEGYRWYRWTEFVMRNARVVSVVTVVLLLTLMAPFLSVRFGSPDERQMPEDGPSRVAMQTLREDFSEVPDWSLDAHVAGYHHNQDAAVAAGGTNTVGHAVGDARTSPDPDVAALADYAQRVSQVRGVETVVTPIGAFQHGWQVAGPFPGSNDLTAGDAAHLQVLPASGVEQSSSTARDMVHDIRAIPTRFDVLLGGSAAVQADSQAAVAGLLPLAVGLILVVTLVLVFLLTGSVVLPIQTVLVNALSLTAMFGASVWIFQDGHLSGLIGFTPLGFLEFSLPVLMFCLAFGLSMDYGVFALSRVKEEHEAGRDHRTAVALGMARTGGLITAAAAILAIVLFAMGTSRVANIQLLGVGVGIAVIVDATIVRCLLVPAVLALTGRFTWYAPAPLRWVHQRFGWSETQTPIARPRRRRRPAEGGAVGAGGGAPSPRAGSARAGAHAAPIGAHRAEAAAGQRVPSVISLEPDSPPALQTAGRR